MRGMHFLTLPHFGPTIVDCVIAADADCARRPRRWEGGVSVLFLAADRLLTIAFPVLDYGIQNLTTRPISFVRPRETETLFDSSFLCDVVRLDSSITKPERLHLDSVMPRE
jgi:hypothetical protein